MFLFFFFFFQAEDGIRDVAVTGVQTCALPILGFVFQFHHLLREFSALENVMMPLLIGGMAQRQARSRAEELLSLVGLAGRMTHRPAQLSGGGPQRCARARAPGPDPSLVLAAQP